MDICKAFHRNAHVDAERTFSVDLIQLSQEKKHNPRWKNPKKNSLVTLIVNYRADEMRNKETRCCHEDTLRDLLSIIMTPSKNYDLASNIERKHLEQENFGIRAYRPTIWGIKKNKRNKRVFCVLTTLLRLDDCEKDLPQTEQTCGRWFSWTCSTWMRRRSLFSNDLKSLYSFFFRLQFEKLLKTCFFKEKLLWENLNISAMFYCGDYFSKGIIAILLSTFLKVYCLASNQEMQRKNNEDEDRIS